MKKALLPILLTVVFLAAYGCRHFGHDPERQIHKAAGKSDWSEVEKLLDANPELIRAADDDGRTLLHHAAGQCSPAATAMLISRGADANARDKSGSTPLHLVCGSGYAWVRSHSSIYVEKAPVKSAEFLLKAGADVNARDESGKTPLALSIEQRRDKLVEQGRDKLVETLREAGGKEG